MQRHTDRWVGRTFVKNGYKLQRMLRRFKGIATLGAVLAAAATTSIDAGQPGTVMVSVSPIDFGSLSDAGVFVGQGMVLVTAPAGTTFAVALSGGFHPAAGSRNLKRTNGSEMLPYNLYRDSNCALLWGDSDFQGTFPSAASVRVTGTGTKGFLTVYGRLTVPPGAPAGRYEDSIVVTVFY